MLLPSVIHPGGRPAVVVQRGAGDDISALSIVRISKSWMVAMTCRYVGLARSVSITLTESET